MRTGAQTAQSQREPENAQYYYGNDLANSFGGSRDYQDSWAMYGYGGNDALSGQSLTDWIFGGTGNDTLYGNGGNDELYGGDGYDWLYGGTGNDLLRGGNHNDVLYGEAGNDTLFGDHGNDWMNGGIGNDALYGGVGNDSMGGGDGADWLYGGFNDDQLYGQTGSDYLYGESGNDTLYGGSGNDWMVGGLGIDSFWGGSGNDYFVVSSSGGTDWIGDFQNGQDKIVIDFGRGGSRGINPQMSQYGAHTLVDLGYGQLVVLEFTNASTIDGPTSSSSRVRSKSAAPRPLAWSATSGGKPPTQPRDETGKRQWGYFHRASGKDAGRRPALRRVRLPQRRGYQGRDCRQVAKRVASGAEALQNGCRDRDNLERDLTGQGIIRPGNIYCGWFAPPRNAAIRSPTLRTCWPRPCPRPSAGADHQADAN